MIWDKFKDYFHESWWDKIQPFIESQECDEIYKFLKYESKRGIKIGPSSINTYRAFKETSLDDLKVVLLSYCPYHTFTKEGLPIADGLAFSCAVTGRLQPSLDKFYEGLEEDVHEGLNVNYEKTPDLTYLANQGVLLLNSSLTVAMGKPGSHQDLWHPFTKYLLEKVLIYKYIPFVFIGKDAQVFLRYVTPLTHGQIFKIEHPSFAARNQESWQTNKTFSKINSTLNKPINWLFEDDTPPF